MSNGSVPIYTAKNWQQIQFLWPRGTWDGRFLTIWLDLGSRDFERAKEKLRKLNPYLAQIIEVHGENGHVVFRKDSKKKLRVKDAHGNVWEVPVMVVAASRAENYKDEFGGSLQRSLDEDTLPLFRDDSYEIIDWAGNNMDWDDLAAHAVLVIKAPTPTFRGAWESGEGLEVTDGEI